MERALENLPNAINCHGFWKMHHSEIGRAAILYNVMAAEARHQEREMKDDKVSSFSGSFECHE